MSGKQEVEQAAVNPSDSFNILKALVMLGMPFVHVIENMNDIGKVTEDMSGAFDIVTALTVFGPTIFMICMGAGLAGTTGYKRMRKLGLQLILINLILNIFRFVIPSLLTYEEMGYTVHAILRCLVLSDIYSFAGLFMILYSFAVQYHISSVKLSAASVIMLGFSVLSADFLKVEIPVISTILGYFLPVSYDSYFPLSAMSIYPCIGIQIKEKIFVLDERRRRFCFGVIAGGSLAVLALSAIIAGAMGTSLVDIASDYAQNSEWGLMVSFTFAATALLVVSVFYLLHNIIKENFISRFLLKLSPLLMPYYVIQWILTSLTVNYFLTFAYLLFGLHFQGGMVMFLCDALLVEALSLWITCKKGFSFSRGLLKMTDYTRWFKCKKKR